MAVHVGGVYVVGWGGFEKGNIIRIRSYEHGYYYYYTIKGKICRSDRFAEDSPFEKSLVYYGCDYPVNLKGNEEEDNMDEKIVVLRNGKVVTATKYADGKKVNSAMAKCHPDDKFDFNIGAKIAVDRLIRENNNIDRKTIDKTLGEAKEELKQKVDKFRGELCSHLDFTSCSWYYFKKGKSQVKVTYKNIESFLWVAEDKGFKWNSGTKSIEMLGILKKIFKKVNELYIICNNGLQFSTTPLKNKTVVDWGEILPLLSRRTVYSNDFNWDKFLNGGIVVEMKSKDFFMFSFVLCAYEAYIILCDNTGKDKVRFGGYYNFVRNNNVELNDLIWCKVKDNEIVFSKAYTRNFGLVPNNCVYKYDGK